MSIQHNWELKTEEITGIQNDYIIMDNVSSSFKIQIMSLIKLRLDISSLSATKKKPCCESNRALLFSARQMLAFVRDGNNKARSSADALQGFFFGLLPKEDHATEGSVILHIFYPQTPQGGLKYTIIIKLEL
jgi:hypothetical protein